MGVEPAGDAGLPDVSLEDMLATRLTVSGFSVRGAVRTRPSFIKYVLSPIVSTGGSFQGVADDVGVAVERLRSTGCFKGVDAYLDRGPDNDANVVVTVTEESLYQIRTGTSVETSGDHDASVEGSLVWRNITGRGETIRATAGWMGGGSGRRSFGDSPSNSLNVEFVKPFVFGLGTSAFSRIGQTLRNHEERSSYSISTRSGEIGMDTPFGRFSLGSAWRELCDVTDKASILVHDEAGHTWKSSIKHRFEVDHRDHPTLPSEGFAAGIETEIAGMLQVGDVSFRKVEGDFQAHFPLGASGAALAFSTRFGGVIGTGGDVHVRIQDRFFLGGPNSLRGFRTRGVGPRDGHDALGGEAYYTATAMLSVPVPQTSVFHHLFGARVHVFGTVGDIASGSIVREGVVGLRTSKNMQELRDKLSGLTASSRVAVGLGIAGDTALGRIELNFCNVIQSAALDMSKTGIQVGLSQSFA